MGLARRDGRVTILRMTPSRFFALEAEWTEFVNLDSEARAVISEALVEQEQRARYLVGDTSWHDAEADGFRPFGYFNRH